MQEQAQAEARRRGVLLAMGGMLAVSTDSLFTRVADADGWAVTFRVGVLTALAMLAVVLAHEHTSPLALLRRDGTPLIVAAVLQAATTTLFVLAIKNTSVANVVVIIAAAPLLAAAMSWVWLGERTSARVWIAMLFTGLGIGIVISGSFGGGDLSGDLLAVGAIASFGAVIVLLRKYSAMSRTMVVGIGGVGMAVVAWWPATITGYSAETWFAFIAMGAVIGPRARVMLATAPRYLPAAEVSLFAPVETRLRHALGLPGIRRGADGADLGRRHGRSGRPALGRVAPRGHGRARVR